MLEAIRAEGSPLNLGLTVPGQDGQLPLDGLWAPRVQELRPSCPHHQETADEVLGQLGIDDPVLDIAKQLEEVALNDEYFVQRGLYPNVDFYSGIIYRALGIPTDMFTVMFALGRLPGWIGQWKEMTENREPIGRPRQVYTGATYRGFVGLNDRK